MNSKNIHRIFFIVCSLFMLVSLAGELMQSPTVVTSMVTLGYPDYLLCMLGILKLLGILTLRLPGRKRPREWAYAGFTFDFLGALIGCAATGHGTMSDALMASLALPVCSATYLTYHLGSEAEGRDEAMSSTLSFAKVAWPPLSFPKISMHFQTGLPIAARFPFHTPAP